MSSGGGSQLDAYLATLAKSSDGAGSPLPKRKSVGSNDIFLASKASINSIFSALLPTATLLYHIVIRGLLVDIILVMNLYSNTNYELEVVLASSTMRPFIPRVRPQTSIDIFRRSIIIILLLFSRGSLFTSTSDSLLFSIYRSVECFVFKISVLLIVVPVLTGISISKLISKFLLHTKQIGRAHV